ncbi:MAG: hypothetical protein RJB66_2086 [Pseudomonadota bacterium]|jgi:two-component system chemotaxis sensor kinase CheA
MDYSVFDMLLEPVFVLNEKGAVLYLNSAASQMTGLSERKFLKASHFLDVVKLSAELPELMKLKNSSEAIPYRELDFAVENGKNGRVQIGLVPKKDHETIHWIMYFRDVTLENTLHQKYKGELEQKEIYTRQLEQAHKELGKYSEGLEKMVDERTRELQNLNTTMRALLDSLDQGFFIFDKNGQCLNVYSKSCEFLLGETPADLPFWEAIKADKQDYGLIKKWIANIFSQALPFSSLVPLGPEKVNSSQARSISLNYYPIIDSNQTIEAVVVVATDRTDLVAAEKAAEREKAYSQMIINVIRRKKEITRFIFDVQKLLGELSESIENHYKFQIQTALRCLHTIKGGASSFAIYDLAQSCHETEQLLIEIQKDGLAKDGLEILNEHYNKVRYEFQAFLKTNEVLLGNEVIHGKKSVEIPIETLSGFLKSIKTDEHICERVREFERDIFYVPIKQFLDNFEETTQALAMKLGKKLKPMIIEGGETPIHREHYSEMFTTLIHQLTNVVDHGIENPILRRFHHKEESGQITIKVSVEPSDSFISGANLVLQIIDDGQGLDPRKIRDRLSTKGIASDRLTDDEVLQFIFKGNLSHTDQVSQISGRGIGMEAIMHKVLDLGGTARVESIPLKGSTLTIKVPYIMDEVRLSA